MGSLGRAQRYVDIQTVQDHVDACFQASLAGIDLAKCRKLEVRERERVIPLFHSDKRPLSSLSLLDEWLN